MKGHDISKYNGKIVEFSDLKKGQRYYSEYMGSEITHYAEGHYSGTFVRSLFRELAPDICLYAHISSREYQNVQFYLSEDLDLSDAHGINLSKFQAARWL